jgi:hypothetical protein
MCCSGLRPRLSGILKNPSPAWKNTLGGYYLERLYSKDSQYSNKIATLTIEGTTGVGYRAELDRMKWIWDHQSDQQKRR